MEFILLNINGENNQLLPSILKTHRIGGIFIFFFTGKGG